jgi:membrane-bound lytic murein transglycosylase B
MNPWPKRSSNPRTRSKHQSAKPPPTGPRWLNVAPASLVVLAAGIRLWLQLAGGDTPGAPVSPVADNPSPQPAETSLPDRQTTPSAPLPAPLPLALPEPAAPTVKPSFQQWPVQVRRVAEERGISPRTLDAALTDLRPIDRVLKQDARQSEYQKTFFEYLQGSASSTRIQRGRALLQRYRTLLDALERKYGVSAPVLIALWGMESDFGAVTGSKPVIATLATLAYDGRRRERFLEELLAALAIIDEGRASPAQMRGSWAGAMGQPQFLPSTYLQHGRDGDGDGRVDIWTSEADTLASTASYLFNLGWRRGEPWIREARLPAGFDHYQARLDLRRSLSDWGRLGVLGGDGQALPDSETKASILLPAGHQGPAILVFENFRVITDWNRSLH